jgi:hypothetical protein
MRSVEKEAQQDLEKSMAGMVTSWMSELMEVRVSLGVLY